MIETASAMELMATQIAQLRTQLCEMTTLLYKDELTGLYNRRALFGAEDTNWYNWVTGVDIDGLKGVNDNYGHQAGDRLIHQVAQQLRGVAVIAGGTAYRLGGDEFVILSETLPIFAPGVPVSWGSVERTGKLEDDLNAADTEMYVLKNARKRSRAA